MTAEADASVAGSLAARLLIHTADDPEAGAGIFGRALLRLRSLATQGLRRPASPNMSVEIDDLRGRQLFSAEEGRPLIDLRLPAGTYHVTARLGLVQRRYTVALENGRTFDLHLRLSSDHT